MTHFTWRTGGDMRETRFIKSSERLSSLGFFMRYPIFLLAFGPPVFRSQSVDVTEGRLDVWSFFQIGLLFAVATWAIARLATAQSILIPREIRSILKYAFLLSMLFLASTIYSPSRMTTAAYSILYLLTWVCIVEFIADVYQTPIDWLQCLFQLRLIAFLLFIVDMMCLFVNPLLVLEMMPGAGIRLLGGGVASVPLICPVMAIVSGYAFLYSLERKMRSVFYFLVGVTGTIITQTRGAEIALLLSLAILGVIWARKTRRSAYIGVAALLGMGILSGIAIAAIGSGRIWDVFNRNLSTSDIESASGRTDLWAFVLHYCMSHPQGMGYVAGFRIIFRQYYSLSSGKILSHLGTAHNTLFDILAGAGWLALAVYLILLAKIVWMALHFIKNKSHHNARHDIARRHGIQCALLLLCYCFAYGMSATEFLAPLRAGFNYLYVIIAVILGATAQVISSSRGSTIHPRFDLTKAL